MELIVQNCKACTREVTNYLIQNGEIFCNHRCYFHYSNRTCLQCSEKLPDDAVQAFCNKTCSLIHKLREDAGFVHDGKFLQRYRGY